MFGTQGGATASGTLARWVAEGTLRLFSVIGLPRANGTALSIALTQSPTIDGQLNEPFSHPVAKISRYDRQRTDSRSFDDGCRHIVERVDQLSNRAPGSFARRTRGPSALMLHDHAKDFSEQELRALEPLVEHVIFVIREPVKNALSRFTRLLNEMFSEEGGALISPQQALRVMKDSDAFATFARERPDLVLPHKLTTFLQVGGYKAARIAFIKVLESLLMVDWDNVARFVDIMRTEQPESRWSVFDGDWLFSDPAGRLRWLSTRMNIEYDGAMLNRWTKGVGEDHKCIVSQRFGERHAENAWNGPVRTSGGIEEKPESARATACQVDDFPVELRRILQRAETVYGRLSELAAEGDERGQ